MMTLKDVREALQDRNAEEVGRQTGIHPNIIRSIRRGEREAISSTTLEKLSDYLERKP
jgi:DNA-binding Xre family transcriptional regulator